MEIQTANIGPDSTMEETLEAFPGARRALFRKFHIGGCSSCSFESTETLAQVCARNNDLEVAEVITQIRESHEGDERVYIDPTDLAALRETENPLRLLDVRTSDEFEAVKIEGSILMDQEKMQEILGKWDKDAGFTVVDHQGKQGLDAASFFLGHGFNNVRCLRGGIDAWSQQVDKKLPRYKLG
jgi:rhodanese-related sulfurtransferase